MNKYYDKLLFVLAVLALAGGVIFYVSKSGASAGQSSSLGLEPAENPYEPVPIPQPVAKKAVWPEPGPQSSGPNWLYDVFTPPKIYLTPDGKFTAEPPVLMDPTKPFGIYLAEIKRKPYRIQIQGFSGDRNKPEDAVLFFFDEERQIRFTTRPGQENADAEIEVLSFTINREIDLTNSVVEVSAIATILDKRSGKKVELIDGQRLFEDGVSVVIRSEQDPDVDIELNEEGASFETPSGRYILEEINLEDWTVTVKKEATEDTEAKIRTLSPTSYSPPETPQIKAEDESNETSGEENNFDFLFN